MSELSEIIYNGRKRRALSIIASGRFDPGFVNRMNFTLLMLACNSELPEVAMALIQRGDSNPGHKSDRGILTALMLAIENNMKEVALAIIATGESEPGCANYYKKTALMLAIVEGNNMTEVIRALIATGESNPGQVAVNGDTALIMACKAKDMKEVALAIIATGDSNPGHVDFNGDTAFIMACDKNMSEVALALLATGKSNINYKNREGKTALDVAKEKNLTEVVRAITDSDQTYITINANRICFDVINRRHLYVHDFLREDEKNIVFMIVSKRRDGTMIPPDSTTVIGITVENLKPDDGTIVYECKKLTDDFRDQKNIPTNNPYYNFKDAVGFGDLVTLPQIQSLVEDVTQRSFSSRIFSVMETETRLLTTISAYNLDWTTRRRVGARHCQKDQGGTVYEIMACTPFDGPHAEMPVSYSPPAAPEDMGLHIILKIKEERVFIPILEGTTMGEVRSQIAEQKGVSPNAVRFIYEGKIIEDAQLAAAVKTGDVVLTMIRQPPPPEGGGRGGGKSGYKHTKKKRGERKGGKRIVTRKNCTRRK